MPSIPPDAMGPPAEASGKARLPTAAEGDGRLERLERSAVMLSFWVGGLGLVLMKYVAYSLSQSTLVRASMFESVGDVLSSTIMAVTRSKVADSRDSHNYPTGKRRLTPLGILFFAAFATSTFANLAMESVQKLVMAEPAPSEAPRPEGLDVALRRLFSERPELLQENLLAEELEELVAEYGHRAGQQPPAGRDQAEGDDGALRTTILLMLACIATKCGCLAWCLRAARSGSAISRTLSMDHRNDSIAQSMVVGIMVGISFMEARGSTSPWLHKVEPLGTLVFALVIAREWMHTAMRQVVLLSNHRADAKTAEAVVAAVQRQLSGPDACLKLCEADVYHGGEGYEAKLVLCPARAGLAADQLASQMEALDAAVRTADCGVHEVHAQLRTAAAGRAQDLTWAGAYAAGSASA